MRCTWVGHNCFSIYLPFLVVYFKVGNLLLCPFILPIFYLFISQFLSKNSNNKKQSTFQTLIWDTSSKEWIKNGSIAVWSLPVCKSLWHPTTSSDRDVVSNDEPGGRNNEYRIYNTTLNFLRNKHFLSQLIQ